MEFSHYGWIWIVLGAIFGPVQVMAYIASIIKIIIDRSRIKKVNNDRRQTRINGMTSMKRPNIQIINDEDRASKFLKNGLPKNGCKNMTMPFSSTTTSVHGVMEQEHKQNGNINVKVTVEHNLVMDTHNVDISTLHTFSMDKNGLDSTFTEYSEGHNESTVFCTDDMHNEKISSTTNSVMNEETNSKFEKVYNIATNSLDTFLPEIHQNSFQKQRPPKPLRSKHRPKKNQCLNGTYSNLSSSGENIAYIEDYDLINSNNSDKKQNNISLNVNPSRKEYASNANTRNIHSSRHRSNSEDSVQYTSHSDSDDDFL